MAKHKKKDTECTIGSGDVYKDVGIPRPKIIVGKRIVKGYIHHTVKGAFIYVERAMIDSKDIMTPCGIQLIESEDYTGRACLNESTVDDKGDGVLVQMMRFRKGDKV
jgi:hypothetical protein